MDRGFVWGAAAILLIGMAIAAAVAGIAWAWAWYQAQVASAEYSSTPFWDLLDSISESFSSAAQSYVGAS